MLRLPHAREVQVVTFAQLDPRLAPVRCEDRANHFCTNVARRFRSRHASRYHPRRDEDDSCDLERRCRIAVPWLEPATDCAAAPSAVRRMSQPRRGLSMLPEEVHRMTGRAHTALLLWRALVGAAALTAGAMAVVNVDD